MDIGIPGGRDPEEIAEAICSQHPSDAQNTVGMIIREMDECVPGMELPESNYRALLVQNVGYLIGRVAPDVRVTPDGAAAVLTCMQRRLRLPS